MPQISLITGVGDTATQVETTHQEDRGNLSEGDHCQPTQDMIAALGRSKSKFYYAEQAA